MLGPVCLLAARWIKIDSTTMSEKHEVDLFRQTAVRYLAFASDFGEALRPFIARQVYLGSYGIVAAYALADTLDRGAKSYFQQRKARPLMPALPARKRGAPVVASRTLNPRAVPALATMADSAMWHGAASLVLPGVLINRTVWATTRLLHRYPALHPTLVHALPSLAGLATIPLVVPHIDEAVGRWMDVHVRPHLPLNAPPPRGSGATPPQLLPAPHS